MKKLLFSIGLCGSFFGINAQQFQLVNQPLDQHINWSNALKVATSATIVPSTMASGACGTNTANITLYRLSGGNGYIFGTNSQTVPATPTATIYYGQAAQKYTASGSGITVTGAIAVVGEASSAAATTQINAKVFSENATTKAPDTQLGLSASRPLNSLVAGSNTFNFAAPIPVSGRFFVAIESPIVGGATSDTLGIVSTKLGCSSTDSLAWVQIKNAANPTAGLWRSVKSWFGSNTSDLDIFIFAIIDIPSGVEEVTKGNLSLSAAFPNPASQQVSFSFGLKNDARITASIFDVTGKLVKEIRESSTRPAGKHTLDVAIDDLQAGSYIYSIDADGVKIFSRFVVAK